MKATKAFEEGMDAFREGLSVSDNPYEIASAESTDWLDAYQAAWELANV